MSWCEAASGWLLDAEHRLPVRISEPPLRAPRESVWPQLNSMFIPEFVNGPLREWPVRSYEWSQSLSVRGARGVTCVVHVMSEMSKKADACEARFLQLVRRMVGMLQSAGAQSSDHVVDITWVRCDEPRLLPRATQAPIGAVHLNGGVTHFDSNSILVFRDEEAERVVIHELLHLFGFDEAVRTSPMRNGIEDALIRTYGVRSNPEGIKLRVQEALTDAMACWLVAHWAAAHVEGMRVGVALAAMQEHIESLAARVILHYSPSAPGKPAQWVEETHVFSYIIIKAAIWPAFCAALESECKGNNNAVQRSLAATLPFPAHAFEAWVVRALLQSVPWAPPGHAWPPRQNAASRNSRSRKPVRNAMSLAMSPPMPG